MNDSNVRELNRKSFGTALASCVAIMFGPGPAVVAGLGLLLTAVAADFGWSRTTFSAVPLVASWAAALSSPFFGRLMDRYGLRRVLIPGIAAFGLSFLAVAASGQAAWMFFGAYLLVGLAAGGQGPVGYNKIVCQWFVRNRGLAIALVAAVGSGLGYALMPIGLNYMITEYGWRSAYLATSLVILLISLPTAFFFLRENTAAKGAHQDDHGQVEGLTRSEGLRTKSFWLLCLTILLGCLAYYGMLLHLFPMLIDRGIERGTAAATISVVAIGAIGGQLSAGVLLDRVNTPKIALLYFAIGCCGILTIHHGVSPGTLMAGAIMVGVGQGAELSVIGYITSRIFGLRAFGALYGLIYACASAAAGLGPLIMGFMFDRLGNYEAALVAAEVALAISAVPILLLAPYAYGGKSKRGQSPQNQQGSAE